MNDFWQSHTYAVIKAMRATGNRDGIVAQWKRNVELWASAENTPEGAALRAWLPLWQARPFYTAAELAPMFPALIVALGLTERLPPRKSTARLAFELHYGGLPLLQNQNGSEKFFPAHGGLAERFFIVERIKFWREKFLTQEEFENVLHG